MLRLCFGAGPRTSSSEDELVGAGVTSCDWGAFPGAFFYFRLERVLEPSVGSPHRRGIVIMVMVWARALCRARMKPALFLYWRSCSSHVRGTPQEVPRKDKEAVGGSVSEIKTTATRSTSILYLFPACVSTLGRYQWSIREHSSPAICLGY